MIDFRVGGQIDDLKGSKISLFILTAKTAKVTQRSAKETL
jgi:hypothetical protein